MNKYLVGKTIKYYRSSKKVKQDVIAKHFAYDRSKISRIEHGNSNDDEMYKAMLEYLGGSQAEIDQAIDELHNLISQVGLAIISNGYDIEEYCEQYEKLIEKCPYVECYDLARLARLIFDCILSEPKYDDLEHFEEIDYSLRPYEVAMLGIIIAAQFSKSSDLEASNEALRNINLDDCGPYLKGALHYYLAINSFKADEHLVALKELEIAEGFFKEKMCAEALYSVESEKKLISQSLNDNNLRLGIN